MLEDQVRRKADLSPAQQALLEKWKRGEFAQPPEPTAIPRRAGDGMIPLSYAQQRLWFLDKLVPGNSAYTIPIALRLTGPLDLAALEWTLNQIVARHDILRTTFPDTDGQPAQVIAPGLKLPLALVDLEHEQEPELAAKRVLTAEAQRPFDLARGPLVRATLLRLGHEDHIALLSMHHIISDGWSKGVLIHELAVLYVAYTQGRPAALPDLPIQYADYAVWQRQWLAGQLLETQLDYWRTQLADLPTLNLLTDHPRPPVQTFRGAQHFLAFPQPLVEALAALSQREGATLFMTLLAAFQLLLARYTGQTDIIVGSPIAGRTRPETQRLVGLFINTLVLRSNLSGNPTFRELARRVRLVCSDAYAHQDLPFEKLVDELHPERDLSRNPLFHVMLTLQNASIADQQLAGLTLRPLDIETGAAQLDLSLFLARTEQGLVGSLEYNTDLFEPTTIARLAGHMRLILEGACADPNQHLANLPLLTGAECHQLLVEWNATAAEYPADACIQTQFEAQAAQTPDAVALVFDETKVVPAPDPRPLTPDPCSLTYAALNARANQLAHHLRSLGVGPEVRVGICIDRSFELIVGLLGILKAGAAYVPLDPVYPAERLRFMIEDSQVRVLLTNDVRCPEGAQTNDELCHLVTLSPCHLVNLAADWPAIARERDENPIGGARADNLAYVIYTSGSTGRPKGVMVSHRNVVNFFTAMDQRLGSEACGIWLAVTSISFDISVLELFWTLTRGFQVAVQPEPGRISGANQAAQAAITFSLFYFASDAGTGSSERYRLLLEGARFADKSGFTAVWTPERHFHQFGGLYPNPSVVSAAIAAVTERIQIRAGSVVLPLHHPIRVAEEWSVVDNLSNGRVGISFASGWHADDFVFMPEHYAERKTVMMQTIETVRALWRGDPVTALGGTANQVAVTIFPRPIQRELPIWLTAAGNPETFRMAGEVGANLLTHLLGQSLAELAKKIAIYRQAWRAHGHGPGDGHVTLMLHTFVGENLEVVRETVRRPFCDYLRSSLDLIGNLARSRGQDIGAADFTEQDMEALLAHGFDRYFATSSLMGTPETCLQMIGQLQEIGVDEVACLIDFGVAAEQVLASLELLNVVRKRSQRPSAQVRAPEQLPDQLTRRQVSHMQGTPSLARMLAQTPEALESMRSLRMLLLGGEALPPALAAQLSAALPAKIINMYGPTETTIWSSTHMVGPAVDSVPIGRPVANTQMVVLDRHMQPVPIGIAGELFIGGAGVVRGYHRQPELTAERFVPNPFRTMNDEDRTMKRPDSSFIVHRSSFGSRLYRTSDLARYRADGTLEFLGRIDQQVKIRGYRIEPGEIEAQLQRHPAVAAAVVVAREDASPVGGYAEKRLVAYVVATKDERRTTNDERPTFEDRGLKIEDSTVDAPGSLSSILYPLSSELRSFLKQRLPDYMIPSAFVFLDALPLTPNGKIDRKALPAPDRTRPTPEKAYVAPRTATERLLAEIWADLLRLERVGVHDNFFELGGDSILSLQVIARATRAGLRLTLTQLFQHQTISALAAAGVQPAPAIVAEQGPVVGPVPLMPFQHWLLEQDLIDPHHWNQAVLFEMRQALRPELLEEVVRRLLAHHDALRLRFTRTSGGWQQVCAGLDVPVPLAWIDLSTTPEAERIAALEATAAELQASLNLAEGLLRVAYFHLGAGQPGRLLIIIHHLVTDGVSWRIVLEDFQTIYQQLSRGAPVQLPPKTTSLKDWAERLTTYARSGALHDELGYWLDDARTRVGRLPVDHPRGLRTSTVASTYTHRVWIDGESTRALLQVVPAVYQSQINDILMTALAWALKDWTGSRTLLMEMEGHGREALFDDVDLSRTAGWLASLFPIVLDLGAAATPVAALGAVKAQLSRLPQRGIGYGLLRYLSGDEPIAARLRALPQAEVRFNYLGQFDQVLADDAPLSPAREFGGPVRSPRGNRRYLLEIDGSVVGGRLQVGWTYSRELHHDATIEHLSNAFADALRALIASCA